MSFAGLFFFLYIVAAEAQGGFTPGLKKQMVFPAWGTRGPLDRGSVSDGAESFVSGSGASRGVTEGATLTDSMDVYDIYYTGGSADMYVTWTGRYEVIFARYTTDGQLLETHNITRTNALMMGYIDVDPSSSSIVFSMQEKPSSDVAIFEVPMNATQAPSVKRLIAEDSLLSLCGDARPCTSASFFSASYAPDGSGRMAFAFRLWDAHNFAIGNQAIGIRDAEGKVHALTYKPTQPFTNNTNTLDTCPRFHPGDPSKIFFVRTLPGDEAELWMVDLDASTSVKLHIEGQSVYDDFPSCPEFSLDKAGLLYIDGYMGVNDSHLVIATPRENLSSLVTRPLVDDPKTSTPWAADILTYSDCQPLSPAQGDVMCLDKYREPIILHNSSSQSYWTRFRLPYTEPLKTNWCKTNSCFRAFKRSVSRAKYMVLV